MFPKKWKTKTPFPMQYIGNCQNELPPPLSPLLFIHVHANHTNIAHSCRRKAVVILSSFSPTSSVPDVSPPSHHPFGRCRRPVNGGPHVKVEDGLASGFWRGGIVVYYITDFAYGAVRGLALDVPIVAVKWGFAAVSLQFLARYSKGKGEGDMKKMVLDLGWIRTYPNLDG